MQDSIRETQPAEAQQLGRGRDADGPRQIPMVGWKDIAWRIFQSIGRERIPLTSAGVTYFLLLSLVPSLTLFVTVYSLFNSPQSVIEQLSLLAGILPAGALDIIKEQLTRLTTQSHNTLSLTLVGSFIIALWTAGAGIRALFEAMNLVYREHEKRSFIKTNLLALAFILAGLLGGTVALFAVLIVPIVLGFLPLPGGVEWLVRIISYLIMLAMLLLGLAALYRWGPNRADAQWRWVSPGGVFATIAIALMSVLFSWYAANFSTYNAMYGSLGALVGMLTWMWLTMNVVILGGLLNSEIEHQTAKDTTTGDDQPLGQRGAVVADNVGRKWDTKA